MLRPFYFPADSCMRQAAPKAESLCDADLMAISLEQTRLNDWRVGVQVNPPEYGMPRIWNDPDKEDGRVIQN